VADASKVGRRHLGMIGTLSDFDTLVMAGAGTDQAEPIAAAAGIRLVSISGSERV